MLLVASPASTAVSEAFLAGGRGPCAALLPPSRLRLSGTSPGVARRGERQTTVRSAVSVAAARVDVTEERAHRVIEVTLRVVLGVLR